MENFSPKEIINLESPVNGIKCKEAWEQLDQKEKLYCYYFFKACWEGSMICWFQRSYESPALFVLLNLIFSQDIAKLKETALEKVSEEDWNKFLAYSAGVFNNCGNYRSFGDTKFVPEIPQEKFWEIAQISLNYEIHKGKFVDLII